MDRQPSPHDRAERLGLLTSLLAAVALLALLHRSMSRAGIRPDLLLLGFASDLEAPERAYIVAVAVACGWAAVKRQRAVLACIQLYALGAALLLTQYNLGLQLGEKVDSRFVRAFLAGVASLFSCYLCLMSHAAIAIRRRLGRAAPR